jgi:hypothetical protein
MSVTPDLPRAQALLRELRLQPHPEGGWYAEVFRSVQPVETGDGRAGRVALTTIDFLLERGQASAWHRVRSDEVWHLLEGDGLVLWLLPPDLSRVERIVLGAVAAGCRPRHVVPADWWQAAEPMGDFAYVGATVGPGFDFADFAFGRDDAALCAALPGLAPELTRLL